MEEPTLRGHNAVGRWVGVVLTLLVAVGLGAAAYQAGVSHGLALQIPAGATAAAPPPYAYYPYGWYRPWGFGLFGPFVFIGCLSFLGPEVWAWLKLRASSMLRLAKESKGAREPVKK